MIQVKSHFRAGKVVASHKRRVKSYRRKAAKRKAYKRFVDGKSVMVKASQVDAATVGAHTAAEAGKGRKKKVRGRTVYIKQA